MLGIPEVQCTAAENVADRVRIRMVLLILGVAGVILAFVCTWRYGAGASPDSAYYLSAARSLLSGEGYRYFNGRPYTHWPPLFPTLLAIFGLTGVEPLVGARLLNGLAFGVVIFLSGELFLRCTRSPALAVLGTVSVLLSAPLLAVSIMAWSEPVFIVLLCLFVLFVPRLLDVNRLGRLLLVSLIAALACLQRYAGAPVILAGGILLTLGTSKASRRRRLAYVVVFCLVSAAPSVAWCVRNRILAGQTLGVHRFHPPAVSALWRALVSTADVVATWFVPAAFPASVRLVVVGLVAGLVGAAAVGSRRKPSEPDDIRSRQIWSAAVLGFVYTAFVVVSGAGLSWDTEPRHMAPAYAFVMPVLFAGLEGGFGFIGRRMRSDRWGKSAGILLCSLWLLYPVVRVAGSAARYVKDGAGEYSTRMCRESPLVHWLQDHPLQGMVYSNIPDALYILTGMPVETTPHHGIDTAELARAMSSSRDHYIVWFHGPRRDFLYDLRELASRWQIEEVVSFSDGGVYRFLGAGGPGISAVYRLWSSRRGRHFYTLDRREKDALVGKPGREWIDEGPAFYVCNDIREPAPALPVHRFWSETLQTHVYVMEGPEKDALIENHPQVWSYEGIAWHAYPEGRQPAQTRPVYRFWSAARSTHFYTIDEAEKDKVIKEYPHIWSFEGVVWYAYGK